jgi:hypothetical protein
MMGCIAGSTEVDTQIGADSQQQLSLEAEHGSCAQVDTKTPASQRMCAVPDSHVAVGKGCPLLHGQSRHHALLMYYVLNSLHSQ